MSSGRGRPIPTKPKNTADQPTMFLGKTVLRAAPAAAPQAARAISRKPAAARNKPEWAIVHGHTRSVVSYAAAPKSKPLPSTRGVDIAGIQPVVRVRARVPTAAPPKALSGNPSYLLIHDGLKPKAPEAPKSPASAAEAANAPEKKWIDKPLKRTDSLPRYSLTDEINTEDRAIHYRKKAREAELALIKLRKQGTPESKLTGIKKDVAMKKSQAAYASDTLAILKVNKVARRKINDALQTLETSAVESTRTEAQNSISARYLHNATIANPSFLANLGGEDDVRTFAPTARGSHASIQDFKSTNIPPKPR